MSEAGWRELLREEQADELRTIGMSLQDGELAVEERSDGELTYRAFGTLTCVRRVTVGSEHAGLVAGALGLSRVGLEEALAQFFSGEGSFLSDLQDCLDRAEVPYSYATTCGNNIALRTAAATGLE